MPVALDGTETLGKVWDYGFPFGLVCSCGHKALLHFTKIGAHRGDQRLLSSVRFTCTKCHSDQCRPVLFETVEEVRAFRATLPPEPDQTPASSFGRR